MATLTDQLIGRLVSINGVTVDRYKDTQLQCVNYKGREVAHFQTGSRNELDIRLSTATIKELALLVPESTNSHPDRSKNSRWIIQKYTRKTDLDKIVRLVELAIQLR